MLKLRQKKSTVVLDLPGLILGPRLAHPQSVRALANARALVADESKKGKTKSWGVPGPKLIQSSTAAAIEIYTMIADGKVKAAPRVNASPPRAPDATRERPRSTPAAPARVDPIARRVTDRSSSAPVSSVSSPPAEPRRPEHTFRSVTTERAMREIAEMFVPKSMYAAVPVRMLPPVRTLTGLAGWGATAGFGLFWMIGDESFAWAKSVVVGAEEEE